MENKWFRLACLFLRVYLYNSAIGPELRRGLQQDLREIENA